MTKRSSIHHPNRIRQLRMEKGLTQRELAHIMGYQSVSSLSHLEAGHKLPSLTTALRLEVALQRFIGDIYPRLYGQLRAPVARRRVALFEKRAGKL
jgi:transcriptional regulator with XRE-family HTH domain